MIWKSKKFWLIVTGKLVYYYFNIDIGISFNFWSFSVKHSSFQYCFLQEFKFLEFSYFYITVCRLSTVLVLCPHKHNCYLVVRENTAPIFFFLPNYATSVTCKITHFWEGVRTVCERLYAFVEAGKPRTHIKLNLNLKNLEEIKVKNEKNGKHDTNEKNVKKREKTVETVKNATTVSITQQKLC